MSDGSLARVVERKRPSRLADFVTRLAREKPLGAVGAVITVVLILVAVFADFVAPYQMNELHKEFMLNAPSARFLLGTDNLGRDILSQIIYGARISIAIGLLGSLLGTVLCALIGILCGYVGGRFDMLIQRLVDAWMSFPGLLILMVILSIAGTGIWQIILVLGIRLGIVGSRVIRSATLGIREDVYLKAARVAGCSTARILFRHILPNVLAPTIILFTTEVPNMILTEASLSFLGYGIAPPAPSWGRMLGGSARQYLLQAPWMALWPGLALSLVVYGVSILGDAVRDILDPRLKGGGGRYRMRKRSAAVQQARGG